MANYSKHKTPNQLAKLLADRYTYTELDSIRTNVRGIPVNLVNKALIARSWLEYQQACTAHADDLGAQIAELTVLAERLWLSGDPEVQALTDYDLSVISDSRGGIHITTEPSDLQVTVTQDYVLPLSYVEWAADYEITEDDG